MEPEFVAKHFIPLAMDSYFRGNRQDVEFCKKIRAGGNHVVAVTAGGKLLAKGFRLKLREKELAKVLEEFRELPDGERRPALPKASGEAPKRKLPDPPKNGLVVRGYCTYVRKGDDGRIVKSREFYYRENPDRWATETQSDILWLTEAEWRSLIPAEPAEGRRLEVAEPIRRRFYSTIGIEYMEGSVNALPARETSMVLTVEQVTEERIRMRLEGTGRMGNPLSEASKDQNHSRGCVLRILGHVEVDRRKNSICRFDLVGLGRAWGNKMRYRKNSAIRIDEYPWRYGIACELVTGDAPMDRIPPYNLLHYGGQAGPYFGPQRRRGTE